MFFPCRTSLSTSYNHDHADIAWCDLHKLRHGNHIVLHPSWSGIATSYAYPYSNELPDRSGLQSLQRLHFLRHTARTNIRDHSTWRPNNHNRVRNKDTSRIDLHRSRRQHHLHSTRHKNSPRLHNHQRHLPARREQHGSPHRNHNMLRNGLDLQRFANRASLASAGDYHLCDGLRHQDDPRYPHDLHRRCDVQRHNDHSHRFIQWLGQARRLRLSDLGRRQAVWIWRCDRY